MMVVAATAVASSEADARRTAAGAIDALNTGQYADAIKALREAELMLPDMPQITYNQAIAEYRLGNYEKARELFNRALTTRDLDMEERIKFNLGNCAYAEALERLSDLSGAIEKARLAISHYRDALDLNREDTDARANIETAYLLIKDLLDKKKKEEEEKQKQQQNPSSQPSQDQECEQPQQGDQDQQQQQPQPQPGEEDQEQKDEQQQQPPQPEPGEGEQDRQDESQPQPQPSPEEPSQDEAQKPPPRPAQPQEQNERKMSKEEADRLLQAVRDKERERREDLRRRATGKLPPVRRDW
jgi:Ca-activated chloride channel family protein